MSDVLQVLWLGLQCLVRGALGNAGQSVVSGLF